MSRDEHSDTALSLLVDLFPKVTARNWVDAGGGFVEKDDLRIVLNCAEQRQELLGSARKILNHTIPDAAENSILEI